MHTLIQALVIMFFAVCLIGAVCWCLSRIPWPRRLLYSVLQLCVHRDPWPGWTQDVDPEWVNDISGPMPAITGAVIPPQNLDAKVRATIARADAMFAETRELTAVNHEDA